MTDDVRSGLITLLFSLIGRHPSTKRKKNTYHIFFSVVSIKKIKKRRAQPHLGPKGVLRYFTDRGVQVANTQ